MGIRLGDELDTCWLCKKDLKSKHVHTFYYRNYCLDCAKPLIKIAEQDQKTRDENGEIKEVKTKEIVSYRDHTYKHNYCSVCQDIPCKKAEKRRDWWDKYRDDNYRDKDVVDYNIGHRNDYPYHSKGYRYQRPIPIIDSTRKIIIDFPIYKKMLYYTQAAQGEISGFGRVAIRDKDIYITDALIFKQDCTSGGTHLNPEDLSKFVVSIINMGFDPGHWRLWWHSHNDFGVFWSGTDDGTVDELSKDSTLYSVCINKQGASIGREDTRGQQTTLSVISEIEGDDALRKQCENEVAGLVTHTNYHQRRHGKEWKKHRQ